MRLICPKCKAKIFLIQRSSQANRYYWGVVLELISEHSGHTPYELHEIFKRLYLPAQYVTYKGRTFRMAGSTRKCNKQQFSDYIERVIAEGASLGIEIPPSDYEKTTTNLRPAT